MLTALSSDLGISEGTAGQAVTVTAAVALVTSFVVPSAFAGYDRRTLLLAFGVLLVASNALVACSPDHLWLLVGRGALGLGIGGFWALSAAVTVRLVPEQSRPKALAIVFSGVAVATVVAVPLGAYFGDILGWRLVFWIATLACAFGWAFQWFTLPALPSKGNARLKTIGDILARKGIALGILAATSVYIVHIAFQTYARPVLEKMPEANAERISLSFLVLGIGGIIGTGLSGLLIERSLRLTLSMMPIIIGVVGLFLAGGSHGLLTQLGLMALWGMAWGAVPVAWSLWLTRVVPDQRETASGIFVAAVQISIAVGAAAGGLVFDSFGGSAVYASGGLFVILCSAAIYRVANTADRLAPA
jgi:predicted MFS family arabinose efflux permease